MNKKNIDIMSERDNIKYKLSKSIDELFDLHISNIDDFEKTIKINLILDNIDSIINRDVINFSNKIIKK